MPIKNLSESIRLPRLGKIRLGIRDERGIPKKTDYFVLSNQPDHKDNPYYSELVKLFGEKPKTLRILIPTEDEETWCEQYYKSYDRTHGLVCKGDGETAMRMIDVKTGDLTIKTTEVATLKELTCAGRECELYKTKRCGEVMNFRFVIPEAPGLGVWQIDTGSINSILNINSGARLIRKAFGRLSMIPLLLTFEPIEVNNPENGKKQTAYVLNLRTTVTLAQLADQARNQSKTFQLDAPEDYNPADLWTDETSPDSAEPAPLPPAVKPEPIKPFAKKVKPEVVETPESSAAFAKMESAGSQPEPILDLEWLKEAVAKIGKAWSLTLWAKENMGYTGQTVMEIINQMTDEQKTQLKKKVSEMLDLM